MVAFRMRPLAGAEPRSLEVSIVRYTPQAVLVANVEEARYRALLAEDGRLLVEARYAVQEQPAEFPQGDRCRPARRSGTRRLRAGRCDQAWPKPTPCCSRSRRVVPAKRRRPSSSRSCTCSRSRNGSIAAPARVVLPALDLPISRTGFQLFYSPRFRIDLQPGAFRLESDPGPFAEALRSPVPATGAEGSRDAERESSAGMQLLIDRFRNEIGGRTIAGTLPVDVTFPALGPSIFLVTELTAESRVPALELAIRRNR